MSTPHSADPVVEIARASMPVRSAHALLVSAQQGIADARAARIAGERFSLAHVAALRAGAAVLALRAHPTRSSRGRRPANLWSLLVVVAPLLREWAEFFAAGAAKRAAAEAGLPHAVTEREADDLVRDAEAFLVQVASMLGLPLQGQLLHQAS